MELLNINREESGERIKPYTYHHSRPIDFVNFGPVKQLSPLKTQPEDPEYAQILDSGYKFIEKRLGFYPLFLAVGRTNSDLFLTGFQDSDISSEPKTRTALFSFQDKPRNGVFMDFHQWNVSVLNMHWSGAPTDREIQSIFKPSWIRNDWISYANKFPGSVQMVVPDLDLSFADMVTVKSNEDKNLLTKLGFGNVVVAKLIEEK